MPFSQTVPERRTAAMLFTIKEGKHRARPRRFRLWLKPPMLEYVVTFTDSCRYVLNDDDQGDWNKLFGIGFFAWAWPMHHRHSARWVWRYNGNMQCIEIAPYCYVDGKRITDKPIYYVAIGQPVRITLHPADGTYYFGIDGKLLASQRTGHRKRWCYWLGGFFGGNRTAPHEMQIRMVRP